MAPFQLQIAKSILDPLPIRQNAQNPNKQKTTLDGTRRDEIVLKPDFFIVCREMRALAFLSRVLLETCKSDTCSCCSVTSLVQSLHDFEALSFITIHD